jgi:Zinc dependent phospholipase C
MRLSFHKKLLAGAVLALASLSTIEGCGLITHVDITLRALNHFAPSFDDTLGYPFSKALANNKEYLMAGAVFPDSGYVCGITGGETAHWEPFLQALQKYIVKTYRPNTPRYDQMVAFMFGVASHIYSDLLWHYGNR